jgi:hypothetical protein
MNRIKEVLEKIYNDENLRETIVPLFIGNPGLGKSHLIYEFAKEKSANIVEFITSQRNPYEISGMGMPDKDTKKMSIWDFDTLLEMKDGDILFFDELLNGNPVVLNACLTLLETRKTISGKKLAKIMIVAAANPQGQQMTTPQIKERFIWYNLKFNREAWIDYMIKKYSITASIGYKLAKLIEKESFTTNNFNTPRSLDKAVNMIIKEVPTPYEDQILLILEELITNPFDKPLTFKNGNKLEPGEAMTWLNIYKKNNQLI